MSFLSSTILGGAKQDRTLSQSKYRRYFARLTSSITLRGVLDTAFKVTVYKIGYRYGGIDSEPETKIETRKRADDMARADPVAYSGSKKRNELFKRLRHEALSKPGSKYDPEKAEPLPAAFRQDSDIATAIHQPYRVTDALAADFLQRARSNTGVSGDFYNSDHSAVVYRLAQGIAYYSMTGGLEMQDLASRQEYQLVPVGSLTRPVIAGKNHIWIPTNVDSPTSPNVLAAIIAAATGTGSVVVTDAVEIDRHNQAIVPTAVDLELVDGAYNALRILGSNYEHCGAGALFAYAMTKGIHSVVSVVGMTDEGAVMRSVLRANSFVPSYGGISSAHRSWTGLSRPINGSLPAWAAFVDGIALTTAAGCAIADPCIDVDGRLYPTTIGSSRCPRAFTGEGVVGNEANADDIGAKLASACPPFAANYIRYLTMLFAFKEGGQVAAPAVGHLINGFKTVALAQDRHLQYPSVSPYYWIEPTGVVTHDTSSFTATAAGYGVLASVGSDGLVSLFPELNVGAVEANTSDVETEWRSARTSGLAIHLSNHERDGLANARIIGCNPDSWAQLGGTSKRVTARMSDAEDLASYLWQRSDCALPAPGEALYLGSGIRMSVLHATTNESTWKTTPTHFPEGEEMGGHVRLSISPLVAWGVGDKGPDRHACRAYNKAIEALDNARFTGSTTVSKRSGVVTFVDVVMKKNVARTATIGGDSVKPAIVSTPVASAHTINLVGPDDLTVAHGAVIEPVTMGGARVGSAPNPSRPPPRVGPSTAMVADPPISDLPEAGAAT